MSVEDNVSGRRFFSIRMDDMKLQSVLRYAGDGAHDPEQRYDLGQLLEDSALHPVEQGR